MKLTQENYKTFMGILQHFSKYVVDIYMTDGVIQQITQNNGTHIKCDVSSLFDQIDVPEMIIINANKRLSMLSAFELSPEVYISEVDNWFIFDDRITTLQLMKPFSDIKLAVEAQSDIIAIREDDVLVADIDLDEVLVKKMNKFSDSAAMICVTLDGRKNKGVIYAKTENKTALAYIYKFDLLYSDLSETGIVDFKIPWDTYISGDGAGKLQIFKPTQPTKINHDVFWAKTMSAVASCPVELIHACSFLVGQEEDSIL